MLSSFSISLLYVILENGCYIFLILLELVKILLLTIKMLRPVFLRLLMQIKYSAGWVKVSCDMPAYNTTLPFLSILLEQNQQVASAVGTFGRVLECWDREARNYVAIKVVRSIHKYREAAKIEVNVLQCLAKNDRGNSQYVITI